MATLLEAAGGVLGIALPFFVLLFVWVIVFGMLQQTKVIGDQKGLHSIIALVVAFMVIAIPDLMRLIAVVVPAFFFLFLFFMLVAIGFLFVKGDTDFTDMYLSLGGQGVVWLFVVLGGIIVALAAGNIFGDQLLEFTEPTEPRPPGDPTTDTGTFRENLGAALFHPAVLGMMAFIIIATLAILFLGAEARK